MLYLAARVMLHAGDADGMDEIAMRLDDKLQSQTTALAGLLRGERALHEGFLPAAIRELRQAWQEYDFWFGHYLMGRAYLEAGHHPEAIDEFLAAMAVDTASAIAAVAVVEAERTVATRASTSSASPPITARTISFLPPM